MKTLAICSGGMDSVTLAHHISQEHELAGLMTFDYGQRHKKEIDFAKRCALRLGCNHQVVDISNLGAVLSGSALTDNIEVPDGHYAQETMKSTVVPNRNAIMLSIAFGAAQAQGCDAVATAVHGGDHFIYPDCRPEFIQSFEAMQKQALAEYGDIRLFAPYVYIPKEEIAKKGAALGVPYAETWSCYKGGDIHCGKCGTCVERREAFDLAGVDDPTVYEDPDFWLHAKADYLAQKKGA